MGLLICLIQAALAEVAVEIYFSNLLLELPLIVEYYEAFGISQFYADADALVVA